MINSHGWCQKIPLLFDGEIPFDGNNTRCLMMKPTWIYSFDGRRNGQFHCFAYFFPCKRCCRSLCNILAPPKDPLEHVIVINLQDDRGRPVGPFHGQGFKRSTARQTQTGQPCPGVGKGSRLMAGCCQDSPFDPWIQLTAGFQFPASWNISFGFLWRHPWVFSKKPLFWWFLLTFRPLTQNLSPLKLFNCLDIPAKRCHMMAYDGMNGPHQAGIDSYNFFPAVDHEIDEQLKLEMKLSSVVCCAEGQWWLLWNIFFVLSTVESTVEWDDVNDDHIFRGDCSPPTYDMSVCQTQIYIYIYVYIYILVDKPRMGSQTIEESLGYRANNKHRTSTNHRNMGIQPNQKQGYIYCIHIETYV